MAVAVALLLALLAPKDACAAVPRVFLGHWEVTSEGCSPELPMVQLSSIVITRDRTHPLLLNINRTWADSAQKVVTEDIVQISGENEAGEICSPVASRVWPYNVYVGVEYDMRNSSCTTTSEGDDGIRFKARTQMLSAQRLFEETAVHDLKVSGGQDAAQEVLRYQVSTAPTRASYSCSLVRKTENSSLASSRRVESAANRNPMKSRSQNLESSQVHKDNRHYSPSRPSAGRGPRGSDRPAAAANRFLYNLNLTNNWTLSSVDFQLNALAIGLQGLANRNAHTLYLTYPAGWDISYTATVKTYLESSRGFAFQELKSPLDAVAQILEAKESLNVSIQGYVVWDPQVRESLVVAYTVAGTRDALVVTAGQVPLMKKHGLPELENLNGRFRGWPPAKIYSWAREELFGQCNRSAIVWAGGDCHNAMKPGVMDFGVSNRAFFTDLDTRVESADEYPLATEILGEMEGDFLVMGWHSYCKDYEHTFTTLASSHGGRVHGLNTNPNLSFMTHVKLPANYTFKNNHSPGLEWERPEQRESSRSDSSSSYAVDKEVFITLVQTDGLGLGAWNKEGRGVLPYAWEVMMPDLEIQPVLLEMFYEQATPNDTFVAALSGPGYIYPKAVPPSILPSRLLATERSMRTLDLHHLVAFDASATHGEHTVTGDTTLSESVVRQYFQLNRTDINGFLNGYGPTFTNVYDSASNRSLLSFDYYLDPERSVDEAVADIEMLAQLNKRRPYFLPIHVREWSTVMKVEQIMAKLNPATYEVVPIDRFFRLANQYHTFLTRYT